MARYWERDEDYFGGSRNHPGCPGGCGELADECACPRPRPLGAIRLEEPVTFAEVEYRATCRWRSCTEDAESRGYCDAHLGTL